MACLGGLVPVEIAKIIETFLVKLPDELPLRLDAIQWVHKYKKDNLYKWN